MLEKNFDLVNGELALQGFLQLHQMEAEDNSGEHESPRKMQPDCSADNIITSFDLGDSAELWVTLNAMGFNHNLLQDEAAPYQVNFCLYS